MKCVKCGKEVPIVMCGQCEECWNKPLVISDPAVIEKLHQLMTDPDCRQDIPSSTFNKSDAEKKAFLKRIRDVHEIDRM